jgi:hypothetical protein
MQTSMQTSMKTSTQRSTQTSTQTSIGKRIMAPSNFWSQRREASLNWLALGLLLAAWNAADNNAGGEHRRPAALRGYSYVSVRAATRLIAARGSDGHE